MAEFKELDVFSFPSVSKKCTPETLYWERLGFPIAVKEFGAIDYIDATVEGPSYIAVTSSSKVQIYDDNDQIKTTLSKFKMAAYGGVFRGDGKLLVAGCEDGRLRVFDVNLNKTLRVFKGHLAAVHRCNFSKYDQVVSFSDDRTVGVWDLPTEQHIQSFAEHEDYIRAGAVCKNSPDMIISGSYDHTIKTYDIRCKKSVKSYDHGDPVQALLLFPSRGILLSAGGNVVKVWDCLQDRLLGELQNHHKTVTSLCFARNGRRVMSGSLDRHVKIYDTATYDVVHTLDYPSQVLSITSSPGDKTVAVGMDDGLVSIRHLKKEKPTGLEKVRRRKRKMHFETECAVNFKPYKARVVIFDQKPKKLRMHDNYLRSYQSSEALSCVLKRVIVNKEPEVTVSVMKELMRRGSLKAALAAREVQSVSTIVKFIKRYLSDPRFTTVLCDVGNMLVDLYTDKLSDPSMKQVMEILLHAFENEVRWKEVNRNIMLNLKDILSVSYVNGLNETPSEITQKNRLVDLLNE